MKEPPLPDPGQAKQNVPISNSPTVAQGPERTTSEIIALSMLSFMWAVILLVILFFLGVKWKSNADAFVAAWAVLFTIGWIGSGKLFRADQQFPLPDWEPEVTDLTPEVPYSELFQVTRKFRCQPPTWAFVDGWETAVVEAYRPAAAAYIYKTQYDPAAIARNIEWQKIQASKKARLEKLIPFGVILLYLFAAFVAIVTLLAIWHGIKTGKLFDIPPDDEEMEWRSR